MKIFNTLTREKEEFVPIEPGKVKMYACGPTVYNFIHIGNARPICVFDTLRRYLEFRGYEVTFVQNFTDIDDKIIKKANEEGVSAKEIAERYINEYLIDTKGLGIRAATIHPKATETIDEIKHIVEMPGLRQAVPSATGGTGERRTHQRRRAQGGPTGLCSVEVGKTGRAKLDFPLGRGQTGLAHRMYCHDSQASGSDHRHPLRRTGFDFPAP